MEKKLTRADARKYGYTWHGMQPLDENEALMFHRKGENVYCLYNDDTEGLAQSEDEIREHAARGGMFGIECAEGDAPAIVLRLKTRYEDIAVPIASIARHMGLGGDVTEAELVVANKAGELSASVDATDCQYPGLTIDGYNADGDQLWLAEAELPNESYPTAVSARLYAGYAGQEFDGPIALVKHDISKPPAPDGTKAPTKIVYVDTETAQYRSWRETSPMPEHAED